MNQYKLKKQVRIFLLTLIIALLALIVGSATLTEAYAEELSDSITVNITVSDVTDYTNPMNILVSRKSITVTDFDLTPYGTTLEDINTIDGITYMHALVQLHIELYGEDGVADKLLLSDDGVTRYFMGRQTANVMYKNGDDIFDLPQNVSIQDGDEIQVCLYNSSYSQGIATFEQAYYETFVGNSTRMELHEHFDSPVNKKPMQDAEIVDEDGLYYTDMYGNIITTDKNGEFEITFDQSGTYIVSAAPVINYYMEPGDGTYKTEYKKVTEIITSQETQSWIIATKPNDWTQDDGIEMDSWLDGSESGSEDWSLKSGNAQFAVWFWWADGIDDTVEDPVSYVTYNSNTGLYEYSGTVPVFEDRVMTTYKEETRLEEVKVLASDEMLPAVSYTLPFAVVSVDSQLIAHVPTTVFGTEKDEFTVTFEHTSALTDNYVAYAASYVHEEDGTVRMLDCQSTKIKGITSWTPSFESGGDTIKVMFWGGDTGLMPVLDMEIRSKN